MFYDRAAAGRQLAERLITYAGRKDAIVLALPRGGVPVGFEVARALKLPLDVMLVRKLGVPGYEELAFGAVALPDIAVFNEDVLRNSTITPEEVSVILTRERKELERRNALYRQGRSSPKLHGKTVLIIDDGIATGAAMRAALSAAARQSPARLVLAAPVAAPEVAEALKPMADETVILETPMPFLAVGQAYYDFTQTEDAEVLELLARTRQP